MTEAEQFGRRMDRLGAERLARKAGLPAAIAESIALVVTATGLPDARREEVFRELVAHFEDGLAAGKSPAELLQAFGEGKRTAALIGAAKRVVTPESFGGTGPGDGWLSRLGRDARYAVRRLLARPAFAATAVASLALAIGANSAMFTLVNDVILPSRGAGRPVPGDPRLPLQQLFVAGRRGYPARDHGVLRTRELHVLAGAVRGGRPGRQAHRRAGLLGLLPDPRPPARAGPALRAGGCPRPGARRGGGAE